MQDIPRNELLDKLAAGWKLRRSVWPKEQTISINGGSIPMSFTGLITDGWEGEPPLPALKNGHCYVAFAFDELKNHKAKFIRRATWVPYKAIRFGGDHVTLAVDDILASDWEVWA